MIRDTLGTSSAPAPPSSARAPIWYHLTHSRLQGVRLSRFWIFGGTLRETAEHFWERTYYRAAAVPKDNMFPPSCWSTIDCSLRAQVSSAMRFSAS